MKTRGRIESRGTAPWGLVVSRTWSFVIDLPVFLAGIGLFYAVITLARYWSGPFMPHVEISRDAASLPLYAFYSLLRIVVAYGVSLVSAIVYGYVAAYNPKAERIMIPILDILQSIPVLSFLPGVMLAMVSLFPTRQLGVELGAIVLIFTGQVWNMAFSFYTSLKSIPVEMREAARVYRFTRWQRFTQMELPYAAIGLIWNSMMSVAGGWFFLMACEMFVLGKRDFRLPGLGSYLQTAAGDGDTGSIIWGLVTMIAVIVLLDQLIWRPVLAWAQKFKFEQVESQGAMRSPILELLRNSRVLKSLERRVTRPLGERIALHYAERSLGPPPEARYEKRSKKLTLYGVVAFIMAGVTIAVIEAAHMLAGLSSAEVRWIAIGTGATFARIFFTLLIASAWAIPVGVWIGLNPRLARIMQPIIQIAASVPATALFPVILLLLIRLGGGLGIGSIVLLLLGTQWYILFNVIAGATSIPTDLKEVSSVFQFGTREKWRKLILPSIFPYLITGLVTATGGAWNASIVAEYFHLRGRTISTIGIGSIISQATDENNFPLLLAATIVMAAVVITVNRTLWRPLYRLSETRFRLGD